MIFPNNIHESWIPLIHSLAYEKPMVEFLSSLKDTSIQPAYKDIFRVFEMPVSDVKVVILGQEPYPLPGIANGLAYAVKEPSRMSKILKFIEKEIYITKGIRVINDDNDIVDQSWQNLSHLVEQGVFLLNLALTVETGKGGSHTKNWGTFTGKVISYLSTYNPCIWMMWGDSIKSYKNRIGNPLLVQNYTRETIEEIPIDPEVNYIIEGENPIMGDSFSNDGFYKTNIILTKKSLNKIIW